ncbi:hypothetical protein K8I61_15795 [bacterium]|nr:hypothetical protein [bacterium]
MATDIFIDSDTGNDINSGADWANAKQHIQAGVDLVTGPVTDVTTIHLKKNTTAPYTGNVTMRGINCTGENAEMNLQPEDWTESKYDDADGSPLDPTPGAGTFDPTEARNTDLRLKIEVINSTGLHLKGLGLNGDDGEAGITVIGQSDVRGYYLEVRGREASVKSIYGALLRVENSYYVNNAIGALAGFRSILQIVGQSTFLDTLQAAVIATGDATVIFNAWDDHPQDYFETLMRVSTPRNAGFADCSKHRRDDLHPRPGIQPGYGRNRARAYRLRALSGQSGMLGHSAFDRRDGRRCGEHLHDDARRGRQSDRLSDGAANCSA